MWYPIKKPDEYEVIAAIAELTVENKEDVAIPLLGCRCNAPWCQRAARVHAHDDVLRRAVHGIGCERTDEEQIPAEIRRDWLVPNATFKCERMPPLATLAALAWLDTYLFGKQHIWGYETKASREEFGLAIINLNHRLEELKAFDSQMTLVEFGDKSEFLGRVGGIGEQGRRVLVFADNVNWQKMQRIQYLLRTPSHAKFITIVGDRLHKACSAVLEQPAAGFLRSITTLTSSKKRKANTK